MSDKECPLTSYDLITDDLVTEALKNDVGSDAKLISWENEDFTNKGDNYCSIVTSIKVQYEVNGENNETSFVVKLNPLRPKSAFSECFEDMYAREAIVLREVLTDMNNQLSKLNLPSIKTPKLYARSLEKGKEVFITENLRKQGFRMHDRKKGLDIRHALLVMEELGRFHASSLLLEETLSPKTIPETYDYFEEPWMDISHPTHAMFSSMMKMQSANACNFLKKAPKYDKGIKWLNNNMDNIGKFMVEGFTGFTKQFGVLNHGDCWTNNLLFKYDEEGNPVDIRFVDLQCSRKSSPACDMNYFYYSSLNGEMRQKYMKTMEKAYYNSLSNVLALAGKEPSFTYTEFEKEMLERKIFGLLAGIILLPVVLAEGDEICELDNLRDDNFDEFMETQNKKFALISDREGGPFKDRFLTMFDEMEGYKIFDE